MIEDLKNFNILTNKEEEQSRLDLCNSCENLMIINEDKICEMCACPIDYVVKHKFKRCPVDKWNIE